MIPPDEAPVGQLPNVGPKTAMWLVDLGIGTVGDLRRLGAVEAYSRMKMVRPREVSLNALWALQAGLMGLHWKALPQEVKDRLREDLAA